MTMRKFTWLAIGLLALASTAARGEVSAAVEQTPPCFARLARSGTAGGKLSVTLPGAPSEVLAMLLDFNRAAGHRAWFKRAEVLEREPKRVLARWEMHGKFGVHPTVTIEFQVSDETPETVVRYQITRPGFGLAVFSGCYTLAAIASQPARTGLTQTVYIDSGLPFVGASAKDISDGLREDAALLREWLAQRRAQGLADLRPSP